MRLGILIFERMKAKIILLVDDEKELLDLFTRILNKDGYRILTAANGEEAIRVVRENNPKLVILDYHMPGIDGIETMKRIKKIKDGCVFIITSSGMDIEDIERAKRNGARYCLPKPFNLTELGGIIKETFSQ